MIKIKKKRRVKLVSAYIIGISIILIFLIFLLSLISTNSLISLGHYAERTNKKNIKEETYTLILENTEVLGNNINSIFSDTQNLASILSKLTIYYMNKPNALTQISIPFPKSLNIEKINNYDVCINRNTNTLFCYWDNNNIPKEKEHIAKSSTYNMKLIGLIEKLYPMYQSVWVNNLRKGFFIKSPISTKTLKDTSKSLYYIYFKKLLKTAEAELKNKSKNKAIWTHPISEKLNKDIRIGVQYPIYSTDNALLGFSGIDINLDLLLKSILSSDLTFHRRKTIKLWDPFLLMKDSTIVTFPTSLYKEFGLADNFKKNYIRYNYDTKLTDSNRNLVLNLFKKFKRLDKGIIEIKINNKKYLIAFSRLPVNNWIFGFIIHSDKLYETIAATNLKTENIIRKQITSFIGISVLFFFGAIVISVLFFKRLVSSPLIELKNVIKKIGKGVFDCEFKARGIIELVDLSRGIKVLGRELTEFTNNIKDEAQERQAVETELNIAAKIQRNILPKISAKFLRKEIELDAKLIPSKIVSGDFYDFFYINKDKLVLILADVSGKGISSAFFMNISKAMIKSIALKDRFHDPARILDKVNREISKDNEACMFLTIYLAFYDLKTGVFTFSNAGHHEIIKTDLNGNISYFGLLGDPALCINPTINYKVGQITLNKGDTIVLYTDGISEAVNPQNEEFGEEKIADIISINCKESPKTLNTEILRDIIKFEQGARFDDITLLTLNRKK
ncbi:MAG TPA: SpoIIE family protein phosphatase [Victivallales bacterium]|nr:SpoIIE family protein phosphatase [Victivallales bacterium]